MGSSAVMQERSLSEAPVRVVICHDAGVARTVVRELLDHASSVEVVGEARGARGCLRVAREQHPDVILLDLAMPVLDGLRTFRRLRADCPRSRAS